MQPLRLLHLFTATVTAFVIGAFATLTWFDYRASERDAQQSLREVARLMEEHTRSAMLVSAVQLNRVAEMIGPRPLHDLANSVEDWSRLKTIMAEIAHADSFWIFDPEANLVLSSLKPSGVSLNASDRQYFTAIRDGERLFISPRIWGKIYGGYYLAMSRPLDNPDGSLKGVVQFSIRESYFSDFYRTLRPEDGASFTVMKTDGALVSRFPQPASDRGIAAEWADALFSEMTDGETKLTRLKSRFDGVDRLYAMRKVAGYPLVVATGLPVGVVFKGFLERSIRNGALAIIVLGAFLLMSSQMGRAVRREEVALTGTRQLLADKEVLFQEIHHRVKNNLQIISSFLSMQAIRAKDPATAEAVKESLDRIHSMGLVHQILYEQREAAEVSMDAYLRALADSIGQSYGASERSIAIEVATDGTRLGLDRAVPLALLANEALTNAMKHAFPLDRSGRIEIRLERQGGRLDFRIRDDGVGIPDCPGSGPGSGLGLHILKALAKQLDGVATFTVENGTTLTIAFPA